jgi:hypothetical protein
MRATSSALTNSGATDADGTDKRVASDSTDMGLLLDAE